MLPSMDNVRSHRLSIEPLAIEARAVSKVFIVKDSENQLVLQQIDLQVYRGQICGILGHNGSGKTILLKILAGVLAPSTGTVQVNGKNQFYPNEKAIGYFDRDLLSNQIVGQVLIERGEELGLTDTRSRERAEILLTKLDLSVVRNKQAGALSHGAKSRLALALALIADPPILLLDEPTENLDFVAASNIEGWIKELAHVEKKAILVATRQPALAARICDRVIVLDHGQKATDIFVQDADNLIQEEYYQIRLRGTLDPSRSAWFENLTMTTEAGDTLLSGVVDQAALHGVMMKIRDLMIPLISVERVKPSSENILAFLMEQGAVVTNQ